MTRVVRTVLLASGFVVSALASAVPAGQQQPPTFRTAISLVRVDVYPTRDDKSVEDLTKEDFVILEDGTPQAAATFEHVTLRPAVIEPARIEPSDLRESNRMAADPRNRIFVLYLDTYHLPGMFQGVDPGPVQEALRRMLRSLIGEDDLVAFMTPEMSVDSLSFVRRTSAVDEFLRTRWHREIRVNEVDERERLYQMCYPRQQDQEILAEMIARKRERQVLETLRAVLDRLRRIREGRTALLLIGGGWTLFGPSAELAAPLQNRPVPGPGRPGVGPTGRLGTNVKDEQSGIPFQECERDRVALARINHEREFHELAGAANRANTSFYPIDPRGLVASADLGRLQALARRRDMLFDLASATDGIPVIDTNDFNRGMTRILNDTSSYYLIGYYSTNTKLDGTFRRVTVRVKRPGVSVRARNGYQAPTEAEAAAFVTAAAVVEPGPVGASEARAAVLALERMPADPIVHVRASWEWRDPPARDALLSIVVELDAASVRRADWTGDASVQALIQDIVGQRLATLTARVSASTRVARLTFPDAPLAPGSYVAHITITSRERTAAEQASIVIPAGSGTLGTALLCRRGPYTGPSFQPTADARFRRAERLRVDIPTRFRLESLTARLLDRNGRPLAIPVTLSQREEAGVRYATGEVVLSSLAAGDYLVEIALGSGQKPEAVVAAFRIVP